MSLINIVRRIADTSQLLSRCASLSFNSKFTFFRHSSTVDAESINKKLMEFFDNKKNWGEGEVKHGRSWLIPELRIKSNQDLHKLWYILLKEKNMLLTMEDHAKEEYRLFPSAERLDKVKKSMANLEEVVKERNKAYFELETGETGQRPGELKFNQLGMRFFYRSFEHVIPYHMNAKWRASHKFQYGGFAVRKFLKLYREKKLNEKRKKRNRDRNEVVHLLKRNPDLDKQLLRKRFPTVNIERILSHDKARGHHVPKL